MGTWLKKVLNSKFLHRFSLLWTIVAIAALFAAWIAGEGGTFLGLSQDRLYDDAIALGVIAVGFRIGCLIHHWEEYLGIRPSPYTEFPYKT